MELQILKELQERLDEVKQHPLPYKYQKPEEWWQSLRKATAADFHQSPKTAINEETLVKLFDSLMKWPATFTPLKKVEKLLQDKIKLFQDQQKIDWATAELLGYYSLINEGKDVRMSGQDVKRGTFSHRHAILFDEKNNTEFNRLHEHSTANAQLRIFNSLLSEYAVLGFEYGYAMANPNALVLWEAQFGDFSNGAQIIIDQFLSSAETKWQIMNGLVMLLPHGYEGQGPEHSSARIERFLQLCADNNIQVVQPTTAAQIFHLLRRQMVRKFRKPLVILTPKSLLRNKDAGSPLKELSSGRFQPIIPEVDEQIKAASVKRVLVCSGKVYYDLVHGRADRKDDSVAIIRVEQLYPFAHKTFETELGKYPKATEVVWVQDEPQNQGPWFYVQHHLYQNMSAGQKLGYAGRPASASPAVGYLAKHQEQQKALVEQAFGKFKVFMLTK